MLFRWLCLHAGTVLLVAGGAGALISIAHSFFHRKAPAQTESGVSRTVSWTGSLLLLAALLAWPTAFRAPGSFEATRLLSFADDAGLRGLRESHSPQLLRVGSFSIALAVVTALGLAGAWLPMDRRYRKGAILMGVIVVVGGWIFSPGTLASGRASNTRNPTASLVTIATAEEDFRSNDRNGNGRKDYWVGDVAGLYTLLHDNSQPQRLIELTIAGADGRPLKKAPWPGIETYALTGPKAGYWYAVIPLRSDGKAYAEDLDGDGIAVESEQGFAYCCYPDTEAAGRFTYIMNEEGRLYRKEIGGKGKPVERWPSDLKSEGWTEGTGPMGPGWWEDSNPPTAAAQLCLGAGVLCLLVTIILGLRLSAKAPQGEGLRALQTTWLLIGAAAAILLIYPVLELNWPKFSSWDAEQRFKELASAGTMGALLPLPFLIAAAWAGARPGGDMPLRRAALILVAAGLLGGLSLL